jgi:hypothetical protein
MRWSAVSEFASVFSPLITRRSAPKQHTVSTSLPIEYYIIPRMLKNEVDSSEKLRKSNDIHSFFTYKNSPDIPIIGRETLMVATL